MIGILTFEEIPNCDDADVILVVNANMIAKHNTMNRKIPLDIDDDDDDDPFMVVLIRYP